MEPRRTFDNAVEAYDAVRPSYPDAVFADLFSLLPSRPWVIEVGPGTGQATRDLIAHGAQVHAIELGPRLAARLRANLPSPDLTISVGDFESITLPAGEADGLFSASAYHWISEAAKVDRPAELLRADGVVAILDLVQVSADTDHGFFDAAQPIYERHGQGHVGPPAPLPDAVDPKIRAAFAADDRFCQAELRTYRCDQTYTAAEYRQLMTSYSVTQLMPAERRAALLDDMEAFIDAEMDGSITRPLVAALTTARRV